MKDYYITSHEFSVQERQTKTKGKVYDVYFRVITVDGQEKQKKLSGYATKTKAKAAYSLWVEDNAEFVTSSPIKKKAPDKATPTVGDLIREYLAGLSGSVKDSVIYDKQNMYSLFVLPRWEKTPITGLTPDELRAWQNDIAKLKNARTGKVYSWEYMKKIRGQLNVFLNWAEEQYGFTNNLPSVKKVQREKTKRDYQFWTPEEFERFISVVDDPLYRTLFVMAYYTGRRKGELFALSSSDIHEDYIVWDKSLTKKTLGSRERGERFDITSTKESKSQRIPYCDRVRGAIAEYIADFPDTQGARFFFGGDRPLVETTVTYRFNKYIAAAGVEKIRMHDLRHSFASLLLANGENPLIIAELIGDTVEQVLKTYCHIDRQQVLSAVQKLG